MEVKQQPSIDSSSSKQIIVTVVGGVILALLGFGANQALAWWKTPSESSVRSKVCSKLDSYTNGINDKKFDAHEIFAPSVEKFILMKNTTPQKINDYVNHRFYEDFQNPRVDFEMSSLVIKEFDDKGALVEVVEYDSFYKKVTKQYEKYRTKVRIVFDEDYKVKAFDFIESNKID